MATKRINYPPWMPILRDGDLGYPGGGSCCHALLYSVFPGQRYARFRAQFWKLWGRANAESITNDWNAVARQLGYTEDVGWCDIPWA